MHARACDAGELSLFTFCSIAQREVLLQIESYLPKSETLRAAEYLRQVSC